jgi:alpha-N-arabinofuranosidase
LYSLLTATFAVDYHQYQGPDWFTNASTMFDVDMYPRNGTQYFVGEYALGTPDTGRLLYPTIQSATVEAAFMTGMD